MQHGHSMTCDTEAVRMEDEKLEVSYRGGSNGG